MNEITDCENFSVIENEEIDTNHQKSLDIFSRRVENAKRHAGSLIDLIKGLRNENKKLLQMSANKDKMIMRMKLQMKESGIQCSIDNLSNSDKVADGRGICSSSSEYSKGDQNNTLTKDSLKTQLNSSQVNERKLIKQIEELKDDRKETANKLLELKQMISHYEESRASAHILGIGTLTKMLRDYSHAEDIYAKLKAKFSINEARAQSTKSTASFSSALTTMRPFQDSPTTTEKRRHSHQCSTAELGRNRGRKSSVNVAKRNIKQTQ